MTDKFRSLLPPGAFHEERAQEQATTEHIIALDTNMVRKVKDAASCPAHLLPWLAWNMPSISGMTAGQRHKSAR